MFKQPRSSSWLAMVRIHSVNVNASIILCSLVHLAGRRPPSHPNKRTNERVFSSCSCSSDTLLPAQALRRCPRDVCQSDQSHLLDSELYGNRHPSGHSGRPSLSCGRELHDNKGRLYFLPRYRCQLQLYLRPRSLRGRCTPKRNQLRYPGQHAVVHVVSGFSRSVVHCISLTLSGKPRRVCVSLVFSLGALDLYSPLLACVTPCVFVLRRLLSGLPRSMATNHGPSSLQNNVPCLPHTTNPISQARDGSNNDREFGGDEFEVNVYFVMGDEYAEDDEAGANDQDFDVEAAAAEDKAQRSRISVRKVCLKI